MKGTGLGLLDKILGWAVTASFIIMILVVMIQVISRYALPWSPHWTEELARFCFIYMVSVGAGLAVKDRAYVSVTIFLIKFRDKPRFYLEAIILIAIIILMLSMLIYSIPLLKIVSLQNSAALQINMAFIYFSMTCMSSFVILYSLEQLITNFKKVRQPS